MEPPRRKRTIGTLVLAGALLIGPLSVFLPWQTESIDCNTPQFCFSLSTQGSATGLGLTYFLLMLDLAGFFIVRTFATSRVTLPRLPVADWVIYLILGVVAVGVASVDGYLNTETAPSYTAGPAFGWVLAMAAGTAISGAALLLANQPEVRPTGFTWASAALALGVVVLDAFAVVIFALVLFFSGRLGVPVP